MPLEHGIAKWDERDAKKWGSKTGTKIGSTYNDGNTFGSGYRKVDMDREVWSIKQGKWVTIDERDLDNAIPVDPIDLDNLPGGETAFTETIDNWDRDERNALNAWLAEAETRNEARMADEMADRDLWEKLNEDGFDYDRFDHANDDGPTCAIGQCPHPDACVDSCWGTIAYKQLQAEMDDAIRKDDA
jgi:hypothetical protein